MGKTVVLRNGITAILTCFIALCVAVALGGCSGSGESNNGGSSDLSKVSTPAGGHEVEGELVSAIIPSGWSLVTSSEMTGASGEDFICKGDPYKAGDPYLQVISDGNDIEKLKQLLESGDPYGNYYGEAELGNGTWYLAEKAAGVQLENGICLRVLGYDVDFKSNDVRYILGSLRYTFVSGYSAFD